MNVASWMLGAIYLSKVKADINNIGSVAHYVSPALEGPNLGKSKLAIKRTREPSSGNPVLSHSPKQGQDGRTDRRKDVQKEGINEPLVYKLIRSVNCRAS